MGKNNAIKQQRMRTVQTVQLPKPNANIQRIKKIKVNNKKGKAAKSKGSVSDMPILQRMRLGLVDDSSSSSSENESASDTNDKKKTRKKQCKQEDEANISSEAKAEMNQICKRLHIGKPPKLGSALYYFATHLECYRHLEKLFQNHDTESIKEHINNQKQAFCRDVKYALYTKGQIVPLSLMKTNISNQFGELIPYYQG